MFSFRKYSRFLWMSTSLGQQPIVMLSVAKQLGVASPHWHGRSWLWWSNLTYVLVSYAAWHDPLISKVQGSKPAICPKAKVQGGSHCVPLHSPWPSQSRRQGAEGDIPTFCLSLSLAQLQLQSTPGLGLFRESLDWSEAPRWYRWLQKEVERVWCVCLQCGEGAGESAWESQIGSIWLWTSVPSVCMRSLPVHIYLYPLAACARGEMRKGRKMFKITFFSPCPLWYLIEMCKPGSAWQCSLLSSRSQKERLERYRKKKQRRIKSGGRKEWETALHLSCQSLAPD